MLLLLGILLDGVVTLILGVVIGMESKASPLFNVCLAVLHGVIAGFCILLLMAARALERDAT